LPWLPCPLTPTCSCTHRWERACAPAPPTPSTRSVHYNHITQREARPAALPRKDTSSVCECVLVCICVCDVVYVRGVCVCVCVCDVYVRGVLCVRGGCVCVCGLSRGGGCVF